MIIKAFWTVEISTKSTMKLGNKSKYFKLTYDLFSKWGINIIWAKHVENIFLGLKNRQYFPVCYNSSDIAISFFMTKHSLCSLAYNLNCSFCTLGMDWKIWNIHGRFFKVADFFLTQLACEYRFITSSFVRRLDLRVK